VQVDDHRMIGGAALGGEDAAHGFGVAGIGPEAVDRFGRKGDQRSGAQPVGGMAIAAFEGASMRSLMACRLHSARASRRRAGRLSVLLEFGLFAR
jgi:hypothetical protein